MLFYLYFSGKCYFMKNISHIFIAFVLKIADYFCLLQCDFQFRISQILHLDNTSRICIIGTF